MRTPILALGLVVAVLFTPGIAQANINTPMWPKDPESGEEFQCQVVREVGDTMEMECTYYPDAYHPDADPNNYGPVRQTAMIKLYDSTDAADYYEGASHYVFFQYDALKAPPEPISPEEEECNQSGGYWTGVFCA